MIYLGLCRLEDLSLQFRCFSLTTPTAPSAGSVHLRLPDTSGLLAPTAGSDTRESSLAGAGLTGAMLVSPQSSCLSHLSSPPTDSHCGEDCGYLSTQDEEMVV